MSVIYEHLDFYREIFDLPNFWKEPFLFIGIPRIEGVYIPEDFKYKNLKNLVEDKGLKEVYALDFFDPKADFRLDLNKKVPTKHKERYKVVLDVGTIEHVFDTKTCLENYFSVVKKGGLLVIVTNVNGYFGHGFHVFNPEGLKSTLSLNGFEIKYLKYTTSTGVEVEDPSINKNILVWLAARKKKTVRNFVVPQQEAWDKKYATGDPINRPDFSDKARFYLSRGKRFLINRLPKKLRLFLYERKY